ncbi:MAG: hypothetical protein IPN94_14785 [Sphingobacteriales bacterium]|nr:hypothetical protein [Sphingobacteriales bacterium]
MDGNYSAQPQNSCCKPPSNNLNSAANRFYSPLVLNMAREEGIDTLGRSTKALKGTGSEGECIQKNIRAYN